MSRIGNTGEKTICLIKNSFFINKKIIYPLVNNQLHISAARIYNSSFLSAVLIHTVYCVLLTDQRALLAAAFYCPQHAGMQHKQQRARKRSFGDKQLLEKLAPVLGGVSKPAQLPAEAVAAANPLLLSPTVSTGTCDVDGGKQVMRSKANSYL